MTDPRLQHRRRLRRIGIAAANAGALILAIWFASGFYGLGFGFTHTTHFTINRGWLEYDHQEPSVSTRDWPLFEMFPSFQIGWRNDFMHHHQRTYRVLGLPIWWLGAPILVAGLFLATRYRAIKIGLCPKCLYDLSGLEENAPCPECGTPRAGTSTGTRTRAPAPP
jgi:hypothetical protein